MYRNLRCPKTTGEKRANSLHLREGIKIRGKRMPMNLVDAWDDLTSRRQKSWKKLRKKQYHVKKAA